MRMRCPRNRVNFNDCVRRWMNQSGEGRDGSGVDVLWPDTSNRDFKEALAACDAGESYNNVSAVIRYAVE